MPELPDRPAPPPGPADRLRAWLRWVGLGRVVAAATSVLAVLAAAYWLVKPPSAATESRLPYATRPDTRPGTVPRVSTSVAVPASSSPEVVVDVAGAVPHRGVYHLSAGSRVADAVRAAGGLGADADVDAVNLAAVLVDGERVYIPRIGEPVPPVVVSASSVPPAGPVNLNTATLDQLDRLPGVGPTTAASIIAHREQYGPYVKVDDLAAVKGIGPAKLAALRGLVTV